MGVERLVALLEASGAPILTQVADVYLVQQGAGTAAWAWRVGERLRDSGVSVVMNCGGGSFKTQLKRADASRARFAVVIGEDEARAGMVSLKPLREAQPQVLVSIEEAAALLRG